MTVFTDLINSVTRSTTALKIRPKHWSHLQCPRRPDPGPGGGPRWRPPDALDAIGSESGTLRNGVTFTPGKVNGAFQFNGGDYVQVPDSPLWAFGTNDFSIELWANFADRRYTHLIGNDEGGGYINKWILIYDGSSLFFHINSPTLGIVNPVSVPWSPTSGRWYHLAVTRAGNFYQLFIDGSVVAGGNRPEAIPDANAPLTIGQAEGIGYMNGALDEISIYDRALSAAEIQQIYNAGAAGKCSTPAPLRIEQILLLEQASPIGRASVLASQTLAQPCPILLRWTSAPHQLFTIQSSTDLRTWSDAQADLIELSPGQYQATICTERKPAQFFRVYTR